MVINRFISKVINRYTLAHKDILVISIEWNAEKHYPPTAYHVIIFIIISVNDISQSEREIAVQ